MRLVSYSNGRQFGLSGLPAMILGVVFAATVGVILMTITLIGAIFLAIRAALGKLLGLFGARDSSPEPTISQSRPDSPNTIEMRRDDRGSWRSE